MIPKKIIIFASRSEDRRR